MSNINLHKRNKFERIEYVRELGFNTEENILINPTDKKSSYSYFIKNLDNVSLRTFDKHDSLGTPHFPILEKKEAIKKITELQKDGLYCILATPINPADCLFCGAIMKLDNNLFIDIADGPGTVRRVTHDGKIDRRYIIDNKTRTTDDELINYCIKQIKLCYLEDSIFEFSWYNNRVGHKNENFIVWEVTDNGYKKSGI